MTAVLIQDSLNNASIKLAENINSLSSPSGNEIYKSVLPLLQWANYIYTAERTGDCDEFIDGFRASLVETIFCVSAGLARLALFSMRSQIDIILSWIYFKDHKKEYGKVQKSSYGFMLKSAVIKYLDEYEPNFRVRFATLTTEMTRTERDPYRLLSAHVHSQSLKTLPSATDFSSLVASDAICHELIVVQGEVTEYLSDILFSCFGGKWAGLPAELTVTLKSRLSEKSLSQVLS